MRRTIYIPIGLFILACGMVAMVRAQQWNGWNGFAGAPSGTHNVAAQPTEASESFGQPFANPHYFANQPQQISHEGVTPVPSRFAAQTQSPEPAQQSSRFVQSPSSPPVMIENKFATDPNYGQTNTGVVPAQATAPSPSDEIQTNQFAQPRELPGSSRRQVALPPRFTNVNEATRLAAPVVNPAQPAQATEAVTSSNQGESIDDGPTSRRPRSLRDSLPETNPQEPRLANRDERPSLPPLVAQQTQPLTSADVSNTDKILFQAEAPALAVTMAGPAKIGVGKTAEYKVAIVNRSTVEAEDVTVVLDLPGWAEITSSEATLGAARHEVVVGDHGRIKWNLFRVEADAVETLTLKLVARESRSFEMAVNWSHAPKTHLARVEVQEPKLELTLAGPRDVLYGEMKTYTITVANPGSGPAENVVINLLPITPGQDKAGVSNLGTIDAGGRQEIEIDLTARQAGELELRAQAFADGGLRAEASEQIHVRRGALEAVVGGPEIKYAGTVAAYQVRVSNTGDAMAENVTAEAVLPRNASFVSATDGGAVEETSGRVQWQIGGLRPGASRVFELRCVLAEAGGNRLEIVTSADDDLMSAAYCNTRVEALADLKLMINDPQGPIPAGEPMVYEVRLINRGTNAAEGVQIASFFSAGIEPISVEGGRAEIGIGQVVFNPITRVAAGQELVFRITAKAESAGNHTFRTEVVCTSPETKLAAQETTRFYGGTVGNTTVEAAPAETSLAPPRFNQSRFGEQR